MLALVERYDGDGDLDMPGLTHPVRRWEIGNEPEPLLSPVDYARLVTLTAQAVHAADPEAEVMNGGSTPLDFSAGEGRSRCQRLAGPEHAELRAVVARANGL